jgi:hypothetical protein
LETYILLEGQNQLFFVYHLLSGWFRCHRDMQWPSWSLESLAWYGIEKGMSEWRVDFGRCCLCLISNFESRRGGNTPKARHCWCQVLILSVAISKKFISFLPNPVGSSSEFNFTIIFGLLYGNLQWKRHYSWEAEVLQIISVYCWLKIQKTHSKKRTQEFDFFINVHCTILSRYNAAW